MKFILDLIRSYPLAIPFITILVAEVIKALIDFMHKRARVRFLTSGGMPSGHSAFVSSLVVVVANREGLQSTAFMITAALALIVMYDAVNLRNEAGKHARALNLLISGDRLEESLGHTLIEVIGGACFGAFVAFVLLTL